VKRRALTDPPRGAWRELRAGKQCGNAYEELNGNRFIGAERGFEAPATEGSHGDTVHGIEETLQDPQFADSAVFSNDTLKNEHVTGFLGREWRAVKIELLLGDGRDKAGVKLNNRAILLTGLAGFRQAASTILKNPVASRHTEINSINFPAFEDVVGVETTAARRTGGNHHRSVADRGRNDCIDHGIAAPK
jgi:hypothetical protein